MILEDEAEAEAGIHAPGHRRHHQDEEHDGKCSDRVLNAREHPAAVPLQEVGRIRRSGGQHGELQRAEDRDEVLHAPGRDQHGGGEAHEQGIPPRRARGRPRRPRVAPVPRRWHGHLRFSSWPLKGPRPGGRFCASSLTTANLVRRRRPDPNGPTDCPRCGTAATVVARERWTLIVAGTQQTRVRAMSAWEAGLLGRSTHSSRCANALHAQRMPCFGSDAPAPSCAQGLRRSGFPFRASEGR